MMTTSAVSIQSSLSTAKDKLITFLSSHNIIVSSQYSSSSSSASSSSSDPSSLHSNTSTTTTTTTTTTIQDLLRSIFHLLDESLIKSLVNQAIEERNHNLSNNSVSDHELLGSYGIIIDCMKEVIMEFQDKCGSIMQQLVALGLNRPGTSELDEYISKLYHRHEINYLLRDLIESSIITYSNGGNVRLLNTLKHIHEVFLKYQYTRKGSDASSSSSSSSSSKNISSFQDTPLTTKPSSTSTTTAMTMKNTPTESSSTSSSTSSSSVPISSLAATIPTSVSPIVPSILISHEKAHDDDDDDINDDDVLNEDGLIRAGQLLQSILTTCMGDANKLKAVLMEKCASGEIDDCYFIPVLRDNIEACIANNYKNKQMILEFALKVVVKEVDEFKHRKSSSNNYHHHDDDNDDQVRSRMITSSSSNSSSSRNSSSTTTTTTHAPQFVDDTQRDHHQQKYVLNSDHIEVTLLPDLEGDFIRARDYTPLSSSSSSSTKKKVINNKKKSLKSDLKRGRSRLAMHASETELHCMMMMMVVMVVRQNYTV